MAAPPYPAAVACSSAFGLAGITQTLLTSGANQISLPVIVASGASSGQATVGDFVYLQTPELAGASVFDANLTQVIDVMALFETAFYLASANGVWKRVAQLAPVCLKPVAKGAVNTLAFGSANAGAGIVTPGALAGFIPILLTNGAIGYIPYWQ